MAKEGIGSKTCTEQRAKFNLPAFTEENRKLGIAVVGNYQCEGRYCYQEGCPVFVKNDLQYSQECLDHREKLGAPKYTAKALKEMDVKCDIYRQCYSKGCPVFDKKEPKDLGMGFKSDGTRHIPANLKDNVNLKVFEEIGDEPKKKGKKEKNEDSEQALRHFINLQSRVLSKLAWHPEIYEALDSLSSYEILERLCGKSVMEAVPPQMGGKMELKASPKTKQMFAELEKKFEKEDEAKGRPPPRNFDEDDDVARKNKAVLFNPDGTLSMTWMDIEDADDLERKKKEGKKKNGEKKN